MSRRHYLWGALLAVSAILVGAVLWSLAPWPRRGGAEPGALQGLGSFGRVPDFSLTERSGRAVKLAELRGRIWVVDFIYTSCKDTCPLESAEMARLQDELAGRAGIRLVSISVDPERDTPKALSRYAERFHADPERWLFLTGPKKEIYRLAQEGFHLSAAAAPTGAKKNDGTIIHGSQFVLVDGAAEIRGYYESGDAEALKRLRGDLISLKRGPVQNG